MVSITFESVPAGAAVFLDNVDTLLITPVTLDVSEGVHTYILRIIPKYEDTIGQISVISGNSYTLVANLKETTATMQQTFYNSMVKIGWYSFVVGTLGLFISLLKPKRK